MSTEAPNALTPKPDAISKFLNDLSRHGRTDCFSAFDTREGKGYKLRNQEITEQVIDAHAKNEQPIAIYLFKGEFTRLAAKIEKNSGSCYKHCTRENTCRGVDPRQC